MELEHAIRFYLTTRKIEENADKYKSITEMRTPVTKKEIQKLTRTIVALT